ncbi:ATP-binding protein [Sagittula salina]|uniref:ATP-binding protein n=1 Tax=Sagittula salina TaxID=2820268 RepID=A0A940MVH6_9RHOB|nr:ATP-binding protein [Sagittula salina]MBP0483659.1 ATP-binding protein [Sagittula salina]
MTNPFIIPSVVQQSERLASGYYPLARGAELQNSFAQVFSRHLGLLAAGGTFEARSLLVTGHSGSGKTAEISAMLKRFNESNTPLPDGKVAKFGHCLLEAQGTWKDLGRKTLHALGYPITAKTKRTQFEIWQLVITQAKKQGVIGIHYDEAQHILRGKQDKDMLPVLDAFKTLMKSTDWPLMLILSGVPELSDYVEQERQLDRLLTRVHFQEIDLSSPSRRTPEDYTVLNDIVGSYAIAADLAVDDDLRTEDFLHRLATAGAFRWGLVIDLVLDAVGQATLRTPGNLSMGDFVLAWCEKTGMNQLATPFTHDGYETMWTCPDFVPPQVLV